MKRRFAVASSSIRICTVIFQPIDEGHVVIQRDELKHRVPLSVGDIDMKRIGSDLVADSLHFLPLFLGVSVTARRESCDREEQQEAAIAEKKHPGNPISWTSGMQCDRRDRLLRT